MDEIMGNIGSVKCLSNISAATPVLSYFLSLQAANLAICTILDFYVDLSGNFMVLLLLFKVNASYGGFEFILICLYVTGAMRYTVVDLGCAFIVI